MSNSNSQKEQRKKTKGLKDLFSKVAFSFGDSSFKEGSSSKEMVNNLLNWAGKNRDEFIQLVSREAGTAIATSLQPILEHLLENKRINITIDLLDHKHSSTKKAFSKKTAASRTMKKPTKKVTKKASKKRRQRKNVKLT